MKHVGMSQSATPATRCLKPTKVTAFAKLAIGTAMLPPLGCGHKSSVRLDPQTSKVKREPFATLAGTN